MTVFSPVAGTGRSASRRFIQSSESPMSCESTSTCGIDDRSCDTSGSGGRKIDMTDFLAPILSSHNKRRKILPTSSTSSSSQAVEQPTTKLSLFEQHLYDDLVDHTYSFLTVQEICDTKVLNKNLQSYVPDDRLLRIARRRWTYFPKDQGTGAGIALDFNREDWKSASLAREYIQIAIESEKEISDKVLKCVNFVGHPSAYIKEEALRWIVQLFDEYGAKFEMPIVAPEHLKPVVRFMAKKFETFDVQVLTAKCFGVFAMNERNRIPIGQSGAIFRILSAAHFYRKNEVLVSNAFWSLAIICRPLGGVEGRSFQGGPINAFMNIKLVERHKGHMLALHVINLHRKRPEVLAKIFWMLVNVAMLESVKKVLVEAQLIKFVLACLKCYRNEAQLQFRAIFALINLVIKGEGKTRFMSLEGGVKQILVSMKHFPDFYDLQQCCGNFIRSLCWNHPQSRTVVKFLGGRKLLDNMIQRFSEQKLDCSVAYDALRILRLPLS